MVVLMWQSLDGRSQEYFRLYPKNSGNVLQGTVVAFKGLPALINYKIDCDSSWFTRRVLIHSEVGGKAYDLELTKNSEHVWFNCESIVPSFTGLLDVDLQFSPSTNTLPIRRLNLAVGESQVVEAVWVKIEELKLERLSQKYSRIGNRQYLYENPSFGFKSMLEVDELGLIVKYGDLWHKLN